MLRRSFLAALALTVPLLAAACSPKRDPIAITDGTVSVENQTSREWRNVIVTVNDHFRGGAPRLASGGRLTSPLSQLQTAFGQRFKTDRQSVFKVEVTATDDRGEPVTLQWDNSRR